MAVGGAAASIDGETAPMVVVEEATEATEGGPGAAVGGEAAAATDGETTAVVVTGTGWGTATDGVAAGPSEMIRSQRELD